MQPGSRRAKAPGLRPRIFASPQTTDVRWLPIHLSALSSTHRWWDPVRQRRRIAAIPFSSSLHFFRDLRLRSTLHEKATGLSCPEERKGYFLSDGRSVYELRAARRPPGSFRQETTFVQERALPPQSNSLNGSPSPHWAGRCLKILLRQTVAQEDHNATRKFGISESQRGARCLAVSLVREGFAWSPYPTEKSDWHG